MNARVARPSLHRPGFLTLLALPPAVWQGPAGMALSGSSAPAATASRLAQLEAVLRGEPTTESELRTLSEAADAWTRALEAQVAASERRLDRLDREQAASLAEIRCELKRIDKLLPQLREARRRRAELETRARELRAAWLTESGA